ncbi:hypothetical protein G7085_01755 [Tessaracoccus sp. HDW20]|nr:hypothetical protein [Tessaracoccus coleopterorum]
MAHETTLESAGRSVVAAGLDLIDADWPRQAVLVVGTGAYAGAVVAGLRHRGVTRIAVHSESGRAAAFAETHGTDHAPGLAEGLAGVDLVVTCSGQGSHLVPVTDVTAPVTFLDLSLRRDVDPAVAGCPASRWSIWPPSRRPSGRDRRGHHACPVHRQRGHLGGAHPAPRPRRRPRRGGVAREGALPGRRGGGAAAAAHPHIR